LGKAYTYLRFCHISMSEGQGPSNSLTAGAISAVAVISVCLGFRGGVRKIHEMDLEEMRNLPPVSSDDSARHYRVAQKALFRATLYSTTACLLGLCTLGFVMGVSTPREFADKTKAFLKPRVEPYQQNSPIKDFSQSLERSFKGSSAGKVTTGKGPQPEKDDSDINWD